MATLGSNMVPRNPQRRDFIRNAAGLMLGIAVGPGTLFRVFDARACEDGLAELSAVGGRGGCIAVGRDGNLALLFNSTAMYRAWCRADGQVGVAIFND